MLRWIGAATAATLMLVVTLMGCGSSSSNGAASSCGQVAACGGDLVGSWKVVNACSTGSPSSSSMMSGQCSGASASVSFNFNGNITFNSDMTFTSNLSGSASEMFNIPSSCLMAGGSGLTCDQFASIFNQAGSATGGDAGLSATCSSSGSNCSCSINIAINNTSGSGTYSTSGNSVTTMSTSSSGGGSTDTYCVSGSTLHLIGSVMGMNGMAGVNSDVVLTKM